MGIINVNNVIILSSTVIPWLPTLFVKQIILYCSCIREKASETYIEELRPIEQKGEHLSLYFLSPFH
jgi:hypothetical protein